MWKIQFPNLVFMIHQPLEMIQSRSHDHLPFSTIKIMELGRDLLEKCFS